MHFFQRLFDTDFMPHGHCYFWQPEILWPHVIGDAITAVSYFIIPFILYRFVKARADIKYPYVFLAFSLFILFCGITHALAVVSVWNPIYRLEAVFKVATAAISIGTVSLLISLYKPLLSIPTQEQLTALNEELLAEIRHRKEVESELLMREKSANATMEFAPVGMATVDLEGRWVKANTALCRLLGYTQEELTSMDFQSVTPPEDLSQDYEVIRQLMSGETDGMFMRKRYLTKSGEIIWVMLGVALIRDENNEPQHFVAQINDITDQVEKQKRTEALNEKLEVKVKKRTAQLEEVNKELEHFSYAVSHDLRGPLKNINGLLNIFQEDYGKQIDPEGRSIIEHVDKNILRMDRLISHFLNFSRLGQQVLEKNSLDMNNLFQETFNQLTDEYSDKELDFQLGSLPMAYADEILLTQVVRNLLSNALKYSAHKEKIQITVTGEEDEEKTIYKVEDNGVGFSLENKQKLFRMFQRLHSAQQFSGHGIGLAFSERIIKRHGGSMWAESEPDQGAQFFFSLPKEGA
jgi:PAS domain S-box-containing protein